MIIVQNPVFMWHFISTFSFCICRLYRLWRTTTRKCCLSTETMDLLVWLHRILSLPSATYLPTSPHMHSNWVGTARTWPHTSICCLRLPDSLGLRLSTCPALLLCWVRSGALSHEYTKHTKACVLIAICPVHTPSLSCVFLCRTC